MSEREKTNEDGSTYELCAHGTLDTEQCAKCGRNKNCRWNEDGDCMCEDE